MWKTKGTSSVRRSGRELNHPALDFLRGFESASVFIPLVLTLVFEIWIIIKGPYWVRPRLPEIFTAYFGVVGVTSGLLAHFGMARIHHNVRHLVEASLNPVDGFAEILAKGFSIVRRAQGELYLALFNAGFGLLHKDVDHVQQQYARIARLNGENMAFRDTIESFVELLHRKISELPEVHMVLLREDEFRSQVDMLREEREGYQNVDTDGTVNEETAFRKRLAHGWQGRRDAAGCSWSVVSVMPQQVIIGRISDETGSDFYATLVFLVGSGTADFGEIVGYYTESRDIAEVYIRYIEGLSKNPRDPAQEALRLYGVGTTDPDAERDDRIN